MLKFPKQEKSLWREDYRQNLYPELNQDLDVDVAVIGAGITGLTTAYLLKQAGLKVAVVEKDTVGGGTSGRNTGKVTSQHDLIYASLLKWHGLERTTNYGEANQAAIKQIEQIIKKHSINCEWAREDHYVYTDEANMIEKFKAEAEAAKQAGLPASFETSLPLPFPVKAAVKFSNQAKFNPQKYVLGLAAVINSNGSYIFEKSNITHIKDGSPAQVRTKKGKINARDVVIATNVPTLPLVARGSACLWEYPKESYIVAVKLPKQQKGMYISPDSHNYSILPIINNGERTLLIGGESHVSGLRGSRKRRFKKLADYAEKNFGANEITHYWSDRDYLSYDDMPLIGKMYVWSKHLYVGTAFMKWGLTGGTVAGMILSDLITGKENKWASTFNSTRLKPVRSIPRVAAMHLVGKG